MGHWRARGWLGAGALIVIVSGASCGGLSSRSGVDGSGGAGGVSGEAGGGGRGGSRGPRVCRAPARSFDSCFDTVKPRFWLLTDTQLENTLSHVFDYSAEINLLPTDSALDRYPNHAEDRVLDDVLANAYAGIAEAVGAHVVERSADFLGCAIESLGEGGCLEAFVRTYGLRAWRRPLTDEEVSQLLAVFAEASQPALGLSQVVQELVRSPHLLMRSEMGPTQAARVTVKLTSYELASLLSYTLWDAPPDSELMELAASDSLSSEEVLEAQAVRMFFDTARSRPALLTFIRHWLGINQLSKDPSLFPQFSPTMVQELVDDAERFAGDILLNSDGNHQLAGLLVESSGYVSPTTAPLYGFDSAPADSLQVALKPSERAGILTQAAWLSSSSSSDYTNPLYRGMWLRSRLLCQYLPPHPPDSDAPPPDAPAGTTARQQLEMHRESPACAACHALIDPLGLALENYDAVGRYRTTDQDQPIDASGSTTLSGCGELTFTNFIDLVQQLAFERAVSTCFARQYLMYATGRRLGEISDCELEEIDALFQVSGYDFAHLVLGVVTARSVVTRRH